MCAAGARLARCAVAVLEWVCLTCGGRERPVGMCYHARRLINASQHLLPPERHGQKRTPADIRHDAVKEMYEHCERNHLPEVWAYLWNSWYCSACWLLWARSAYGASIPVCCTTMMVEALWHSLKCLVLHLYNCPPVDLTVFMLITRSLDPYRLMLARILQPRGGGQSHQLTQFQAALKR